MIKNSRPQTFLLDTTVHSAHGFIDLIAQLEKLVFRIQRKLGKPLTTKRFFSREYLVFNEESSIRESSTMCPHDVVAIPSKPLVELLLRIYGFRFTQIMWNKSAITDWSYLDDYKDGRRVSYMVFPVP